MTEEKTESLFLDAMEMEILQGFLDEALDSLDELDEKFVQLETNPEDQENIDFIFRSIHSIKGNASFFNLNAIKTLSHKMENLLDEIRQKKRNVTSENVDLLLKGIDYLKSLFSELKETCQPSPLTEEHQKYLELLESILSEGQLSCQNIDEKLLESFIQKINTSEEIKKIDWMQDLLEFLSGLKKSCQNVEASKEESDNEQNEINSEQKTIESENKIISEDQSKKQTKEEHSKKHKKNTMRIDEETIDGFMKYVGELIISSEVFNYLQKQLEGQKIDPSFAKEFKNANVAFNELSNDLQRSLMDVRKVSVKNLFSKIPRMVRDLVQTLNKDVDLELVGEDVRIDKSLLEVLEDPLVHMVRNSLDHGLEGTEERVNAGKDGKGKLKVEAACDKTFFYLKIIDDGRGIHPQKIKSIAIEKGVISKERANLMSDQDLIKLIFAPGFSSAEVVSEVSGRGVGMDVVLTNIKEVNGEIDVQSEVGQGTTIIIKLPLTMTLIVIPGLLICDHSQSYVLPLENVKEVTDFNEDMISSINGKSKVVTFREKVYPLVNLSELFRKESSVDTQEKVLIFVEKAGVEMCLLVDRLEGLRQVVLKSIGDEFEYIETIAGAVILGDGRVGLVLDVLGIMNRFEKLQNEKILAI